MVLTNNDPLLIQIPVPSFFLCPISLELMLDPVTLSSGQTYDRSSIQTWLDDGNNTCPITRMHINAEQEPIPNHALRRMIQAWCVQNKASGVERIRTPRQPPSLKDIPLLLDQIQVSLDEHTHTHLCSDALQKLCMLVSTRPKARRLLIRAGALRILSLCLSKFLLPCRRASPSVQVVDSLHLLAVLLEESEAAGPAKFFWEPVSTDEVLALAEIIAAPQTKMDVVRNTAVVLSKAAGLFDFVKREMGSTQGFMTRVIGLIREAVSAASMDTFQNNCNVEECFGNPALALLLMTCKISKRNQYLALEAGVLGALASLLVTLCPGKDAVTCQDNINAQSTKTIELGLRLWASMCKCAEGRVASWNLMGLLLRLMCNVSQKATKYSTRILWLLLKYAPVGAPVAEYAVEHGGFLKAMAVAQGNANLKTRSLASKIAKALGNIAAHSNLNLE